jgi:hypothetical protein
MKGAGYGSGLSTRIIFIVISIVIASILVDTSIVKISVFTGGLHGSNRDIAIYAIISLIYGVAQFVLLKFIIIKEQFKNRTMMLVHKSVTILQFILISILAISIIQMIVISSYNSMLLKVVTWINYSMSIVFLGLLAKKFISWFTSRRNKVLIAYAIAMVFLCMSNILAILDISYELTGQRAPEYIRPTKSSVGALTTGYIGLNTAYFITSVLSFISTWFATVLLLHHYSTKIGKIKFWIIVSIPLVYFLSQFQTVLIALFAPLRISDPILFGVTYTLAFSATKPVGGILFGVAFWIVSKGLSHRQVKDYMIISGYGLLLLFTANQHQVLQLNPYPPFGLPTISYIGLASYFILIGVYSSALSVVNDVELRRSIRKSVEENSDLLGNIGEAQFEDQLQKTVIKKTRDLSDKIMEETGIASSLEEHDIHDYVLMAINEAKRTRSSSNN